MEETLRELGGGVVALVGEDGVEEMPPLMGREANLEPVDINEEPENQAEKNTYVSPNGKEDRTMVYPCYLNSKRTCQQGRKVEAAIAVEEPLAIEIYEACRKLELNAMVEVRPPARAAARTEPASAHAALAPRGGDLDARLTLRPLSHPSRYPPRSRLRSTRETGARLGGCASSSSTLQPRCHTTPASKRARRSCARSREQSRRSRAERTRPS